MRVFSQQNELVQFARKFILHERIASLEKDVKHCLFQGGEYAPAPFPALLYCFSTIDLLGALYCGDATKRARTSDQSKKYMLQFMSYTDEQAKLLQELFRHKLVHLAQPQPLIIDGARKVSWRYYHNCRQKHLVLERLSDKKKVQVTSNQSIEYDHVFHISVFSLMEDVKCSVEGPSGYLAMLETTPCLQANFERAVSQIYGLGDNIGDSHRID